VLRRTLRLEAGDGPAERKEWAMSTHPTRTRVRTKARFILVLVALAIAATVLTVQASAIWSGTKPVDSTAVQTIDTHASDGSYSQDAMDRPSLQEILAKKYGR
jgi:hypothetical protein